MNDIDPDISVKLSELKKSQEAFDKVKAELAKVKGQRDRLAGSIREFAKCWCKIYATGGAKCWKCRVLAELEKET